MLIVEQNANLALDFADARATCSRPAGSCSSGTADEIGADEGVRRSYLGMV